MARLVYCSVQDVRDTMETMTSEVVSDTKITKAIIRATSEVESYLDKKYVVPLTSPIPDSINEITADLACSKVIKPAHSGDGTSEEVPYSVTLRRDAISRLNGIIGSKTNLPGLTAKCGIYMTNFNVNGVPPAIFTFDPSATTLLGL